MATYRLTPTARASLRGIVRWTNERFGRRQAEAHRDQLLVALDRIAEGAPSRSLRDTLAPGAPADLRFVKAGAHLILFREREGQVEITDVLHEVMDVAGRVRE